MTQLISYRKISTFALALFFFLFGASVSHAYYTTDQQSFALDERTGVFLITFQFAHRDHDVHVPIFATESREAVSEKMLSYEILDRFEKTGRGVASGIVLSNAAIEDGMYVVPKGKVRTFTFLGIFAKDPTEPRNKYRAQVTSLPFSFDGTQELYLKPSELQYYKTPELTLE